MNSLELVSLKKNIKDELNKIKLPKEALRLILKEVYEEISREAVEEAIAEANLYEQGGKENERSTDIS